MANRLMNRQAAWLAGFFAMLVLGFTFAGASRAQTQTTTTVDVRNFEVIAVDGNHLVLRDERGTNEYTVPGDFVFTVDGKKMTVADLKAGMKGKATVTTTTTVVPVVVTELRSGVVLSIGMNSVTVLDRSDGVRKKFTRDQLNARGIQVFKDGRVIPISELNKGDDIVATIVSQRAPDVVTEQEVQATLAQPEVKTEAPATKSESTAAKTEPTVGRGRRRTPPVGDPADGRRARSCGSRSGEGVVRADRRGHRGGAVSVHASAQRRQAVSLNPG